jgi:Subtilase family
MVTSGLNVSDLTLLKTEPGRPEENQAGKATVFATPKGLINLRTKIDEFAEKNRRKKDGSEGRPYHADLVQSIGAIVEAGLRALWRSPDRTFPVGAGIVPWEVWLDKSQADGFMAHAGEYNVSIGADRLEFPEDIVVIANATRDSLALAIRRLAGVRALAAPTVTADYFDAMEVEEQAEWLQALQGTVTFAAVDDPNYITLLDRGVGRAHPLIAPALSIDDRHAADPAWSVEDLIGHGTQLAGLSLYGDLTVALQNMLPIQIKHRLESAKIIPDAGYNPHHLLGAMTRAGINAAEIVAARRRTFTIASTTEDDTPHDGAPTSWSSEIDQLAAGASGIKKIERLILISAGNANQNLFGNGDYLQISHLPENEIESPAHAWNAISVGAYTEKNVLPLGEPGAALAPTGDLSPSSRTASWLSHWPIKPDVVLEGGNWLINGPPPPLGHSALSLLTTDHQFPIRAFTTCGDTSAATALAARAITELWADYPQLWPETIRALFVSSARWTPQMRSHLPANPTKGDYDKLFQRYGFGVPEMERARRSASNALTLIVQDTIIPYRKSDKPSAEHVHNQMKLFELPWPLKELRKLNNTPVNLRVSLSTFIQPNPSEPARGSKFRYASHNLRFKLNRPNEGKSEFLARISKIAEQIDGPTIEENDGWAFGRNRRDVGSIQIDELTCRASDLARRSILAVHPVSGWWKTKTIEDPENCSARFALVVEIDAGTSDADLYAEVQTVIENRNLIVTVI